MKEDITQLENRENLLNFLTQSNKLVQELYAANSTSDIPCIINKLFDLCQSNKNAEQKTISTESSKAIRQLAADLFILNRNTQKISEKMENGKAPNYNIVEQMYLDLRNGVDTFDDNMFVWYFSDNKNIVMPPADKADEVSLKLENGFDDFKNTKFFRELPVEKQTKIKEYISNILIRLYQIKPENLLLNTITRRSIGIVKKYEALENYIKQGGNVNASGIGGNPLLYMTIAMGAQPLTNLLLKNGADIDRLNDNNLSIIDVANQSGVFTDELAYTLINRAIFQDPTFFKDEKIDTTNNFFDTKQRQRRYPALFKLQQVLIGKNYLLKFQQALGGKGYFNAIQEIANKGLRINENGHSVGNKRRQKLFEAIIKAKTPQEAAERVFKCRQEFLPQNTKISKEKVKESTQPAAASSSSASSAHIKKQL